MEILSASRKKNLPPFSYLPFVAGLCNGNSCCMPILLSVFVTSNYWRVFRFEVLLGFPCVYLFVYFRLLTTMPMAA